MIPRNEMLYQIRLRSQVAQSYVYRKQKERLLINLISETSVPKDSKFEFLPSIGASGGILTAWNDSLFLVTSSIKMPSLSQSNSHVNSMVLNGY